MKKRLLIIVLCLLLLIPSVAAADDESTSPLKAGAKSVTTDSWLSFHLDLSQLPEDITATAYSVSIMVTPSPDDLANDEGLGQVNVVDGTYQVDSADLDGISKLHFTVYPQADTKKQIIYTVTADITSSSGEQASYSFDFIAVPKSSGGGGNNKKKPSGGNSQKQPSGNAAKAVSGSSSSSKTKYKGCDNNYLEKLSVSGYEFTQDFNKTNDTYFITVPEDTDSVSVTAVPCHSDATAVVAGSSDLQYRRSKILISVTADNGDVRTYRIIVDKENTAEDEQ